VGRGTRDTVRNTRDAGEREVSPQAIAIKKAGGPSFPVIASFHDTRSNLEHVEKQFYVCILKKALV
jgi:hypothetical protein